MARVTYVKKAQASKRKRSCTRCSKEIKVGDPYKWFAMRIGRMSQRKNFCDTCQIRQSDRTTSHHLQSLYVAIESADDALDGLAGEDVTLSNVAEILREAGSAVREVGEGYQESADAIEEGFGHSTSQSEEIAEKASDLETFADELESAADDIEGLDDPDAESAEIADEGVVELGFDPQDPSDPDYDADAVAEYIENTRDERREAALDQAREALCNCPM